MPQPARVLLVDSVPIVRAGIAAALAAVDDVTVCGEAGDPGSARELTRTLQPDVVVTELSFQDRIALEMLKGFRARVPRPGVVVFSDLSAQVFRERALRCGASAWVQKSGSVPALLAAIRRVAAGERELAPPTAEDTAALAPVDLLSDRELQVYDLIGRGLGTTQIAKTLHLSPKTIESHKERLKRKLSLESSGELVVHAVAWNQGGAASLREQVGPDPHDRPPYGPEDRRGTYCLSEPGVGLRLRLDPLQPAVLGRGTHADVRVASNLVSRQHAMIAWDACRGYVLQDLDSLNGVFVNGHRVASECLLLVGDRLRIGNTDLHFHRADAVECEPPPEDQPTQPWQQLEADAPSTS